MKIVTLKIKEPNFSKVDFMSEIDKEFEEVERMMLFTHKVNSVADSNYEEIFAKIVEHFSKYRKYTSADFETLVFEGSNGVYKRALIIPFINGYSFQILLQPVSKVTEESKFVTYFGDYRLEYDFTHISPEYGFGRNSGSVGDVEAVEKSLVERIKWSNNEKTNIQG